jgi:hypothetical protein
VILLIIILFKMKTIIQLLAIKEILVADFDAMKAEEKAALYNELSEINATAFEEMQKNGEDLTEAVKTLAKNQAESVETIMSAMKAQGLAITKLMTSSGQEVLTVQGQLAEQREEIKAIAKGESGAAKEVAIKALTNLASVDSNTGAYNVPGVGQLGVRTMTMFDMFPKIQISGSNVNGTVKYWDWDEATIARAATMIAEGTAFPESTAKFKEYTCPVQKVGDSLPVTEEFLEDETMFASELDLFLRINVALEVDDQLLNGDGTGVNLKGLNTSAPAYTAVASGIVDASIYDLIVKLKEGITTTRGGKYRPDFAIMNIADINLMKLKKDSQNNYILPPFVDRSGNVVDGISVIENNAQAANTMVFGDSRFARIYEQGGFTIARGMVNNQFLEDTMTIKVRQRLAFLIREVDKTGFLSVADIAADLVTLATP